MKLYVHIMLLALALTGVAGCDRKHTAAGDGTVVAHGAHRGTCFYDSALVCDSLGDMAGALHYYAFALDNLRKTSGTELARMIHYSRAGIYSREGMYDECEADLNTALGLSRMVSDTASVIIGLEALAKNYILSGEVDSARYYHDQADRLCRACPEVREMPGILLAAATYHNASGNHHTADTLLRSIVGELTGRQRLVFLSEWAAVAESEGDTVAALQSLKSIEESAGLPDAYLASLAAARLNPEREQVGHALVLADSMRRVRGKGIGGVLSSDSFRKPRPVNVVNPGMTDIKVGLGAFLALLAPAVIISLFIWLRSRRSDLKKLRLRIGKPSLSPDERCDIAGDEVLGPLRTRLCSSHRCPAKDWLIMGERLKVVAPEFYRFFYETTAISTNEQRVASLIRLELPVKEIARIMCKSENGISTIKARLSKKLYNNPKATARDLDKIIASL